MYFTCSDARASSDTERGALEYPTLRKSSAFDLNINSKDNKFQEIKCRVFWHCYSILVMCKYTHSIMSSNPSRCRRTSYPIHLCPANP